MGKVKTSNICYMSHMDKGNLEEQTAVNARNQKEIEKQRKIMEESQKKAAEEREEFIAKIKAMEADHAKEVANRQDEHQRLVDSMIKDAEKKSEADKKEMPENVEKIQEDHKVAMKDMQDKHQKDGEVAEAESPDGASVIQTILGVIPHVAPALESIAKVIGRQPLRCIVYALAVAMAYSRIKKKVIGSL